MKNTRYKIAAGLNGVVDTLNQMHIPMAAGNRHWQEFEAWMEHEMDNGVIQPSMSKDEFKELKIPLAVSKYVEEIKKGFVCKKSSIKYDCSFDDILSLMGVLGVAELLKKKKIKVRDYNNNVHNLSVSDFKKDVVEITEHHQKLVEKKWKEQNSLSSKGYSAFKRKELENFKKKMKQLREEK